MKPKDLILRCYAHPESDGTWFAICIDLNLYARADSFEEAQSKLYRFIREYITEAFTTDKEHVGDLIPRPAPLVFQLHYYFMLAMVRCLGLAGSAKG